MKLNLKANTKYEKLILKYLEENASDTLCGKINNGKKTLSGCMDYVKNEARKQENNGVAIIEDAVVYGWAIHFFEEDSIGEEIKPIIMPAKKAEVKQVEKSIPIVEKLQISLFDL